MIISAYMNATAVEPVKLATRSLFARICISDMNASHLA